MFTSCGPMNFLRRSFHLLNPVLINNSGTSGKLAPFVLDKEQKFLFFTRGLCQLTQAYGSPSEPSGSSVQMKGLPYEATTTDVINFFKPLNIEPVEVIFQINRWGQPNGLATAKFKSYNDALKALQNHRNYLGRRYVELSLAMGVKDREAMGVKNRDLPQRPSSPMSHISPKVRRVILRGLPYEATAEDVIQFFAPLNIKPTTVEMKYRRFNVPSGICHCVFESQEDAVTALKNHKEYLGERWIEVFLASGEEPSAALGEQPLLSGEV